VFIHSLQRWESLHIEQLPDQLLSHNLILVTKQREVLRYDG
jgi:hypothetical protein